MKDTEFKRQKKRIVTLIDKWHTLLGLKWWKLSYFYGESSVSMPKDVNEDTMAACKVRWEYMEAVITWNMQKVQDQNDKELENAFLHECMHILVNEMRADRKDIKHEERVCSTLANAFIWVREAKDG